MALAVMANGASTSPPTNVTISSGAILWHRLQDRWNFNHKRFAVDLMSFSILSGHNRYAHMASTHTPISVQG